MPCRRQSLAQRLSKQCCARGQLHGLVAVVGAERAPASDEEWCREEIKKWVDGCRPKQPLVTRLQAALQEAVVPDGDRRSPFDPCKEQAADPRGWSAMDRVFTARVVELRGRGLEDVMNLTALKRGGEGEGLLAFEGEETVGTQKRMKLLTSFAWVEAFKAAAKDTGVIQGPERETPEQHARTVVRRYVDSRAVTSAMAGGGATASLRTLLDLALGMVEPTPAQLGLKPTSATVGARSKKKNPKFK